MGVTNSSSRSTVRLALVTNPPPAAPGAPTGVPAGLRLLRTLDRCVLEVARDLDLRPMELYALLLLSSGPLTTRRLSEVLSASPSQAKQIALRLAARDLVVRGGSHGTTELTARGRELADRGADALEQEISERISQIEAGALAHGSSTLSALLLSATA